MEHLLHSFDKKLMGRFVCFLLIGMVTSTLSAQFKLDLPYLPSDLSTCYTHFDDLDRQISTHPDSTDIYTLAGEPYSGCAVVDYPSQGQTFYFDLVAGKITRRLSYYRNGQKQAEFHFQAGRSHGRHEMFYPNGQPYVLEHYKNGKKHGEFKRWDRLGTLLWHASFEEGRTLKVMKLVSEGC